jgi:hypothetical protein
MSATGNQESSLQNDQFHVELPPTTSMAKSNSQLRVKSAAVSLNSISQSKMSVVAQQAANISSIASVLSTISSPSAAARWLVRPRKFDRVFHIAVDPDEFEIDYEKTVSTPHGKDALNQMISDGVIVSADENQVMITTSRVVGIRYRVYFLIALVAVIVFGNYVLLPARDAFQATRTSAQTVNLEVAGFATKKLQMEADKALIGKMEAQQDLIVSCLNDRQSCKEIDESIRNNF